MATYLSPAEAGKLLGCSARSVARAAKTMGLGVVAGGRFVAITPRDAMKLKGRIHTTPGNPDWIRQAAKNP